MTAFVWSSLVLAGGSLLAGAGFWALLNVPESNVIALLLSLTLAMLVAAVAGMTMSLVLSRQPKESLLAAVRRSIPGLGGFLIALAAVAALWLASASAMDAWNGRRGEIDAAILYRTGVTNTAWLHQVFAWTMWSVRWLLGISLVAGVTAATAAGGLKALGAGVKLALRLRPLATLGVALGIIGGAVWPAALWRPRWLPADSVEVVFAAVKLGVLYAAALILVTYALRTYSRESAAALPRLESNR